jgi:hypothetical protein
MEEGFTPSFTEKTAMFNFKDFRRPGLVLTVGVLLLIACSWLTFPATPQEQRPIIDPSSMPPRVAGRECQYPGSTSSRSESASSSLLVNGGFEEDAFGLIKNWSHTNIELRRWYLVQADPDDHWIGRIDLELPDRRFVLKSVDYQNCNSYCSVEAVQIIPAAAERTYTLSAEGRVVDGSSGSIYLDFLDANRGRIKVQTRGGYGEGWSRQTNEARAPAGTCYLRVILYSGNTQQGILYWDNVELLESN